MFHLLQFIMQALQILLHGQSIKRLNYETSDFRMTIYKVNTIIRIDIEPWNVGSETWNERLAIHHEPHE